MLAVDANPVAQTATITFDSQTTSIADLQGWIRDCGLHCAGRSVPNHVCDPMEEPAVEGRPAMSMDQMVRDMRQRFVVSVVFSVPILLSAVSQQAPGDERSEAGLDLRAPTAAAASSSRSTRRR